MYLFQSFVWVLVSLWAISTKTDNGHVLFGSMMPLGLFASRNVFLTAAAIHDVLSMTKPLAANLQFTDLFVSFYSVNM